MEKLNFREKKINIEIYTRPSCSHCNELKRYLNENSIQYNELILDKDVKREYVLERFPNVKTLPICLVDNTYIGGKSELMKIIEMEKLNVNS